MRQSNPAAFRRVYLTRWQMQGFTKCTCRVTWVGLNFNL